MLGLLTCLHSRVGARKMAQQVRQCSAFELALHEVCSRIPSGKVSTYGAVAKVLRSSPRAVGQALRRNPYAPEVPCHRVVAASLQLGGYYGVTDVNSPILQRKRTLLEFEGVGFDGDRVVKSAVMGPEDF